MVSDNENSNDNEDAKQDIGAGDETPEAEAAPDALTKLLDVLENRGAITAADREHITGIARPEQEG